MSATRLVYKIPKAGSWKNLNLAEEPISDPGPGEVRIQTKAVGLNFADIFALLGLYSATPDGSFVPGLEYSGIIEAVGKGVKGWKKGDKVMGVTRFGGYASRILTEPDTLYKLPKGWNFAEGASFLAQALTAYYAVVELGNAKKGQIVLVHSAAGGVGLWANRIAKKLGALTIGTVGTAEKLKTLQEEEFDAGIVREPKWNLAVSEILAGRDLSLVLEATGGKVWKDSYELLSPMGRIVTYGSANFMPKGNRTNWIQAGIQYLQRPKVDPLEMISENKSVMGFNLIWLWEKKELFQKFTKALIDMKLGKPLVGHRYPFAKALDAIAFFQSGKSVGKVVLELD